MAAMQWKLVIVRFVVVAVGLLLMARLELGQVARAERTVLLQKVGELAEGDQTNGDGDFLDIYEFTGEVGQTIGITLESIVFDPMLGLLDETGNVLAENNDIGTDNHHSFIRIVLPNSGVYRVGVLPVPLKGRTVGKGTYRLTIVADDEAQPRLSEKSLQQVQARQLQKKAVQQFRDRQLQEALESWKSALDIYREVGDLQGEANTLSSLGLAYSVTGQYEQAIDFHLQYLDAARKIGDDRWENVSLRSIAEAYFNLGMYEQALAFSQQRLRIAQDSGNHKNEANSLAKLGDLYLVLGRYGKALNVYKKSLAIARKTNDKEGEITALGSIGNAYISFGQYERAIEFLTEYLSIAQKADNSQAEAIALGNLGNAYLYLREHKKVIEFHQKSLAIDRVYSNHRGEAASLSSLGIAYDMLGQYEEAIRLHKKSLAIKQSIGDRQGEANSLGNLGISYHGLGEYEKAIDFHQKSLAIDRDIADRRGEADSLTNKGNVLVDMGRYIEAEALLRQSVEIHGWLQQKLSDSQLISVADTQVRAHNHLERALIAQNKVTEALIATEQSRGQAFALQLASRLFSDQVDNRHNTQALSMAELQKIARETQTTLVTYSVIFNQTLNIYITQPHGEIQLRSIPLNDQNSPNLTAGLITNLNGSLYRNAPPSKLTSLITDTRAGVTLAQGTNTPDKLKQLHNLLIDPIADLLPKDPTAKVAFIPDGNLFLVPFAALQDENGTHLIEKYTILTAPSIQVYGLAHDAAATKPLSGAPSNPLIVGDPTMPTIPIANASGDFIDTQLNPLPGAKAEAKAVGKTLNAQPLLGNQATEAQVKQQLPTADLIHFATHGLLQYGDPQAYGTLDFPGAIALAPGNGEDGLLTSAEILEMDLNASLAILSACDTGRGRITGDGVVGLSRSLITAGVPSVIVSLWAVPDAPTAELMTEFYRQLSQGQDKAQALRQAMLATMKKHPNPRDWAAFTLMGSGI